MTDSTLNAMARLGGQYAAAGHLPDDDEGSGHYDGCPLAWDRAAPQDDCICDLLVMEHSGEPGRR